MGLCRAARGGSCEAGSHQEGKHAICLRAASPRVPQPRHGSSQLLALLLRERSTAQPPGERSKKGLLAKKVDQELQRHQAIHRSRPGDRQLHRGSNHCTCMVGFSTGGSTAKINALEHSDEVSFSMDSPAPHLPFRGVPIHTDRAVSRFCGKPSARQSKFPGR